jgi:hypothetical protein
MNEVHNVKIKDKLKKFNIIYSNQSQIFKFCLELKKVWFKLILKHLYRDYKMPYC